MTRETTEQPETLSVDQIGVALLSLHHIESAAHIHPEHADRLMAEHEELGLVVGSVVHRRPYILTRLKELEVNNFENLEAAIQDESLRSEETITAIGRSAAILTEIAKLQTNRPVPKKVTAVLELIAAETEKNTVSKVVLVSNESVLVNGTELILTPCERYIFEALLDTKGTIAKRDIYTDEKFVKLTPSGSRHFFTFRNAYTSLTKKLVEAGMPEFAKDATKGDGMRDKDRLQRTVDVEVEDKNLMSSVDDVVDVLIKSFHDDIHGSNKMIASIFFGIPECNIRARHIKVIDLALERLTAALKEITQKDTSILHTQ